ncbi:MAG: hypothetical protein HKL95_09180 [Phycisphaerae bacterium]|nr:hypothetical protein [Phycisphaerae bacterium]
MPSTTNDSNNPHVPHPNSASGSKLVHAVLEEDQLYAFKQKTHFGRRDISPPLNILLWALRIYVIFMMAIVVVQIIRTI